MKSEFKDEERMPAPRPTRCLHCGSDWGLHNGWCCPLLEAFQFGGLPRKDIPEKFQYFTPDMIKVPEEDWFAFKHFKAEDADG